MFGFPAAQHLLKVINIFAYLLWSVYAACSGTHTTARTAEFWKFQRARYIEYIFRSTIFIYWRDRASPEMSGKELSSAGRILIGKDIIFDVQLTFLLE